MKINRFNEQLNYNLPEIGDYVICEDESMWEKSYINNKIGKIIDYKKGVKYEYSVEYVEYSDILPVSREEIKYFSKNKKELEMILQSNKFNI